MGMLQGLTRLAGGVGAGEVVASGPSGPPTFAFIPPTGGLEAGAATAYGPETLSNETASPTSAPAPLSAFESREELLDALVGGQLRALRRVEVLELRGFPALHADQAVGLSAPSFRQRRTTICTAM